VERVVNAAGKALVRSACTDLTNDKMVALVDAHVLLVKKNTLMQQDHSDTCFTPDNVFLPDLYQHGGCVVGLCAAFGFKFTMEEFIEVCEKAWLSKKKRQLVEPCYKNGATDRHVEAFAMSHGFRLKHDKTLSTFYNLFQQTKGSFIGLGNVSFLIFFLFFCIF
jgi:hypothetical protein